MVTAGPQGPETGPVVGFTLRRERLSGRLCGGNWSTVASDAKPAAPLVGGGRRRLMRPTFAALSLAARVLQFPRSNRFAVFYGPPVRDFHHCGENGAPWAYVGR